MTSLHQSIKATSLLSLRPCISLSAKFKSTNSTSTSLSQQYNGNKYTFNLDVIDSSKPIQFNVVDDTKQLESSLSSLHIPNILCKNQKFRKIARHYLPHDFPYSVTSNYLPYTLRMNLGTIFGSANAVLATQSLLYALGLGYGSIPLAATLNWILKDFSGQLLAMYLASKISSGFDAYVRKWRFLSCLYYEGSIFLEAITPLFHSQIMFLVLASIANAGKNICWLSTSASKAHINKYMCERENLADVTGKAVSQAIVTNLMGTSLGMLISLIVTTSNTLNMLPIVMVLSSCHILAVYKSLYYIHDPLLNVNRCHILLKEFIDYKRENNVDNNIVIQLTKPDDMSKNEKLLNWKKNKYNTKDNELKYKVEINQRLDECFKSNDNVIELIYFYENIETNYWISIQKRSFNKINVWYKTDATNMDVLESMLAVGYLQYIDDDIKNSIEYGKQNCEQWISSLKQSKWNVDNMFIELAANRIEY